MVNKKKIELGLSDEEEVDKTSSKNTLSINKNYADRYEKWRNKEEIQKLKDKYGDVDINDSDESTSESEDEEAKELNENVEKEFFKALSLVKSRDARIYDKEKCRFFETPTTSSKANEDEEEDEPKKDSKKDKKAYHLKDLERDMILKKMEKDEDDGNIFEEDDDEEDDEKTEKRKRKMGYYEEQDDLKKSFKDVIKSVDDEDNDFLQVKNKTKEEKDKEEADFIEWLRGKKEKVKDPEVEKSMKYLHDYWNDPNLNEGEKYLRDYILNKRYLFKDEDEEENESDEEVEEKPAKKSKTKEVNESSVTAKGSKDDDDDDEKKTTSPLDYVDFSEEESIIENQEEFERKYNFRYEEPDPEFIKSYPRTLADSVRRKKTKRKEKREEYKKRKELEKQRKKEEIKRLKSLKRKEIETKLEKIKKITGNDDLKLTVDDLEKEFDPEEYEKKMQTMFDDQYYEQKDPELNQQEDNDDDKPVFTDDSDEDLKYMSWDNWPAGGKEDQEEDENEDEGEKKKKKKKKKKKDDEDEYQDPEFDMDCEAAENEKAKALKKTKLAQALLKEKPTFDPNEKSFEEYFEEYYKMDCEDVIGGDLPCRFKYREVVANDFGLTVDEILAAKDNELNKWASLKKVIQYRPIQDEIQDTKVYKNRKNQIDFKKKVLTSLFESGEKEDEDEEEDERKDDEKDGEQEEKEETKKVEVSNGKEKPKKESEKNKKESNIPNGKKDSETKTSTKNESKSSKANHKHKPKNKNMLESITDERLASFGLNPKKFKKKIKYSGNNKD